MQTAVQPASTDRSGGYFRPRRLGHVNLYVGDLERMMEFYKRVFGIEEVYRTPANGGGFLSNGNTHHDIAFLDGNTDLAKARGAKPGQLNHLGFELGSEVELVHDYERALEKGYRFMRTADHDIAHSVYHKDPNGLVYELYSDVVYDWRNQRSGIVTKPKPNWTPGSTPPIAEPLYHVDPEIRRVDGAIFHIERASHATIVVDDIDATVDHYTEIVGLNVSGRGKGDSFVVLSGSCGERSLIVVPASRDVPACYHHVSMPVIDPADLAKSVERAKAEGVEIEVDITHAGRRSVFVRDPEGFLTQVYCDLDGEPRLDEVSPELALYVL
ncbi:MAG TPA: VOC family protein [Pseudolabrys sp.]|nr:VOC family protein [Pseudolabrys sp.]